MSKATTDEIKKTLADRDFWCAIGAPLKWGLIGWDYRTAATFLDEHHHNVEVTSAHVRLINATTKAVP